THVRCLLPVDALLAAVVDEIRVVVGLAVVDRRPRGEWRGGLAGIGDAARRIFPFGLGGQAVGFAGLAREPAPVLRRIRPGAVGLRTLGPAPPLVARLVAAGARGRALIPLRERHLVLADRERLPERHLAHRALVLAATLLAVGRAHQELAGGYYHHGRAGR